MMQVEEISKLLAGLGLGTGTGAIITAVINSQTSKGRSRAEAADLLVNAAERVGKFNESLDEDNRQLRILVKVMQMTALSYLDGTIDRETFMAAVKEWKV